MNRFRFRSTAILAVGPAGILPAEPTVGFDGKKPDSVWQISKTLDAVERIAIIKNPDGVWTIPQTRSAKLKTDSHARR